MTTRPSLTLLAFASATVFAAPLAAQTVPTPREHFGFDLGADRKLADWTALTAWYEKLARASDRVKVDTIGTTTKGRPFVMLTITSPQNHARIAELQDVQLRLSDPRRVNGNAELQQLLDRGRTVVLITHGIHSTEVGGAQAAARLAWKLASMNDERTREILDNVILLQVPSLNPDGTQWVNEWYNTHVGTDFEGTPPPWLYQFYTGHDNNRDWYAFTQKETQATIEHAHNAWHPQIVHDIHQMGGGGARIFFPPYMDPVEPNVDPAIVSGLNQLGAWMAADLTAQGKPGAVINAIYDAFAPARAYQHYHGGVRILSETASARLATPVNVDSGSLGGGREYDAAQRSWNYPLRYEGGEWGLPDIVDYQEAGALALLTNAARNRRFWLENFFRINERAVNGWERWPAAWLLPADSTNPGLNFALRILTMADVEVHRAQQPFNVGERAFPAGTYVVPMKQPYASFAQTMLEVQHYPDLREFPGGPPKRPYDVTAHTLPLLMNFEAVPVDAWESTPRLSDAITVPEPMFRLPAALTGRNAPRIGYYKSWQEPMEGGWTRWVLDMHGLAYDTIRNERISAGNLRRDYDVLLFQTQSAQSIRSGIEEGTYPEAYTGGLGDEGVAAIRAFVEQGGRLVAIEEATDFAIETFELDVASAVIGLRPQDFYVPGSIVKLELDAEHPIAASVRSHVYEGPPDEVVEPDSGRANIHSWYWDSSRSFHVRDANIRVIAQYVSQNPVVSGWILGPERIAGRPALLEASVGQGSVVLFGFQPNYRGHSVGTWPLLFNALTVPRRR